jgi:small redox-active disulfide protein 2
MKVQVLGTGCSKCRQLIANVQEAARQSGLPVEIEKVEDLREIMKYRVMSTPALVIEGSVKSTGRVLAAADVLALLRAQACA